MSLWKTVLVPRNNLRDPFHSTLCTYRDIVAPEMIIIQKGIDVINIKRVTMKKYQCKHLI